MMGENGEPIAAPSRTRHSIGSMETSGISVSVWISFGGMGVLSIRVLSSSNL